MASPERYQQSLRANRVYLTDKIQPRELWSHLRECEIITDDDEETFKLNKTRRGQVEELLKHMDRKTEGKAETFFKCLEKCGHEDEVSHCLGQGTHASQATSSTKRKLHSDNTSSSKQIRLNDLEEDDLDLSDGPIDVSVTPSKRSFYNFHKQQAYQMSRECRGHALIINVQTVVGLNEREGTDVDRDNLKNLWAGLHFRAKIFNDEDGLSAEEIMNKVKCFVRDVPSESQACVICLLSHGAEDQIYGSDGETFPVNALISLLYEKNAPKLAGKPKIVILQACRGSKEKCADDESDSPKLRPKSDIIVCYPTEHGYVSWRNKKTWSWFIPAIVQVFMKNAHNRDIEELIEQVNSIVSKRKTCITKGLKKQDPEYDTSLQKDLFFFPDIWE